MSLKEYKTPSQIARKIGCTRQYIYKLCRQKRIRFETLNGHFFIPIGEAERIQKEYEKNPNKPML